MMRYLLLLLPLSLFGLENSIIPLIEKYEEIENLPAKKFSHNQFQQIKSALEHKDDKVRIVTFNMLMVEYEDKSRVHQQWPDRLPRILEVLQEMQPDIISTQELNPEMVQELLLHLGKTYAYYGPKTSKGEQNGLFFRKSRFESLHQQTWRVENKTFLNMIHLKDLKTNREFMVFNTHLAFSEINLREKEVRFIADKLATYSIPHIFTGDLNFFPCRLDLVNLPAYDGNYLNLILRNSGLVDAEEVSLLGHLGPISTFTNSGDNGIPFRGTGTPGVILDHLYVSKGITVLMHAVQPATQNGYFPSDHMPVMVDFFPFDIK